MGQPAAPDSACLPALSGNGAAAANHSRVTNDPWLAELVRRVDAGDTIDFSQTPETSEDESSKEKIEELAEIICRTVMSREPGGPRCFC